MIRELYTVWNKSLSDVHESEINPFNYSLNETPFDPVVNINSTAGATGPSDSRYDANNYETIQGAPLLHN